MLRDLFWLTLSSALIIGWVTRHYRCAMVQTEYDSLALKQATTKWALDSLVDLIEERDGQVLISDESVALYIVAKDWRSGPGWTSREKP